MMQSFRVCVFSLLFACGLSAQAFASVNISWVPPYGLSESKKVLDSTWTYDGKGWGVKDGLTYLNLQWWQPTTDGDLDPEGYATTENIQWFVDWGRRNGVKIQFCLYNPPLEDGGHWNWAAAQGAFRSEHRLSFIKKVLDVVDAHDLDGVDIDFECNERPDPQACNADTADYKRFMQILRDSLHLRGKTLTYASFADQWNGPNWVWWPILDTIVDAWATMNYASQTSAGKYRLQVDHVPEGSIHKFALGVPTLDSWQDLSAETHLAWLRDSAETGIAIWDIRLLNYNGSSKPQPVFWHKGSTWAFMNMIRERGAAPVDTVDGEQVLNNVFDGTDHWNVRVKNGSVLSTTTDESGLHVTIDSAGTAPLAISVNQHDMTLVAGETYTFAFRMSASREASVLAVVGLGSSPYTQYSSHTIDAADTLTVYEYTFVATETTTDARVVFEVSAEAGTVFNLQSVSMAHGNVSLLPDYTPLSSSAETSSSASSGIGDRAFALPGFRAAATVYGITGEALLSLPEGEWSSVETLRDAVRGQLPSGVYLVKFDGLPRAMKLPVGD